MPTIVICDSSAIIDLAKARLIENLLRLPYEFIIPDVLYADELITLEHYHKHTLVDLGFTLGHVDGQGVAQAAHFFQHYAGPSLNDFFALALSKARIGSLLLTGDNRLRKVATAENVTVHGVLWAFDEINSHQVAGKKELLAALHRWQDDEAVWLPRDGLQTRIRDVSKRR